MISLSLIAAISLCNCLFVVVGDGGSGGKELKERSKVSGRRIIRINSNKIGVCCRRRTISLGNKHHSHNKHETVWRKKQDRGEPQSFS